jgi:1-phosphatidylinositol-4-phosphate 5-kinase
LNGLQNGHGRNIDYDGDVYMGYFKGDIFHGKGKLIFYDGSVHEGDWENGLQNG